MVESEGRPSHRQFISAERCGTCACIPGGSSLNSGMVIYIRLRGQAWPPRLCEKGRNEAESAVSIASRTQGIFDSPSASCPTTSAASSVRFAPMDFAKAGTADMGGGRILRRSRSGMKRAAKKGYLCVVHFLGAFQEVSSGLKAPRPERHFQALGTRNKLSQDAGCAFQERLLLPRAGAVPRPFKRFQRQRTIPVRFSLALICR